MSRARRVGAWARGLALGAVLTAGVGAPCVARAQCPSRAACPNPCDQCRVLPASGTNPSVAEMSALFDRIAEGPSRYGDLGWNFGSRGTISRGNSGCGGPITRELIPAYFPCVLLKAIYTTESNWRQFCDSGLTVVAFDCGYGIAQVTSGMRRGDTSAFDPARVASSPAYNVSVGAAILRDKWLAAPCVGANDPSVIEHWYFATWGYNGFAFKNNPNNPMYRADRVEFRTPGVASAQTRGNYPYQELVWGYAHYPPSAAHWSGVGLVYPPRAAICATCGSPMTSLDELEGAHRASCPTPTSAMTVSDAGLDAASADADASLDAADEPDVRDDEPVIEAPRDTRSREVGAVEDTVSPGCACRTVALSRRPSARSSSHRGALFAALCTAALVRRRTRRRADARR